MKKTLYLTGFLTATAIIVTFIAWLGYYGTIDTIIANREAKIDESIALLYSAEEGYKRNENQTDNAYRENNYDIISSVYEVLDSDGNLHAVIYDCTFKGRNGPASALVAVDPVEDKIVGVTFYDHIETNNLGEKYTREDYILGTDGSNYTGLVGQSISDVTVDVIAGASTTWIGIVQMFDEIAIHYNNEEVHIDG